MKLPVAVQLYSVRDDLAADFAGTLEKVKEMGYDGVEFAGLCGNSPAAVKELCQQIGLVPLSAHVPLEEMIADPEGTVSVYCELGCKQIVIPYLTEKYRPGAEEFSTLIAWAKKLGALCKDMDSDKDAWEKAIAACVKEKLLAVNLKAFELGYHS